MQVCRICKRELPDVIGNVSWISGRANRIKYNATVEELRAVADWMERATTIPKGSTPKQVEKVS